MGYLSRKIQASTRFRGVPLDGDTARKLTLLRLSSSPLPAPADPKTREELATTASELEGIYGRGKWCGADGKKPCRDLQALENVLAQSRRYDELLDAWSGWHTVSRPMRPLYERLVALGNQGAKEIGYGNLGELWRAGYDMTPAEFERDTDRLWNEVRPFYEELHCYARTRLARVYGADKVSATGPIPAHLLGNMWAQEWREIYPLLEPFKGQASLDVSAELKRRKYDAVKMVKLGEAFFTSLGFDPLPASFWERSLLNKPRDRDVVCHASAWNLNSRDDLRIKMCVQPKEDDLLTIHHELGHVFYYQSYAALPVLYQSGANDGFHEAVGDAIQLSVNAEYLKRVGLLSQTSAGEKAILNAQMKDALERVAFLPFGKLVDQWRWDVFSGKVRSSDYNAAWWELRRKYQGVAPPLARTAADFDPGAKYHVPANVPYTRYFLARFLQFQFHKGMCQAAGHKGPLHACSIYGNAEAGKKLKAMLALGASKPWPDALEVLTGDREIRAEPLMEYYAPLREWLRTQNAGQKCGW
ncbi:MAG TPA: M2 family metallopeptidase, partial [Myxococcaceae bacterium]|nr:M2 family metallopeptidase [Myxococcaceae bacterium]